MLMVSGRETDEEVNDSIEKKLILDTSGGEFLN